MFDKGTILITCISLARRIGGHAKSWPTPIEPPRKLVTQWGEAPAPSPSRPRSRTLRTRRNPRDAASSVVSRGSPSGCGVCATTEPTFCPFFWRKKSKKSFVSLGKGSKIADRLLIPKFFTSWLSDRNCLQPAFTAHSFSTYIKTRHYNPHSPPFLWLISSEIGFSSCIMKDFFPKQFRFVVGSVFLLKPQLVYNVMLPTERLIVRSGRTHEI